jgi:hypothetical protein
VSCVLSSWRRREEREDRGLEFGAEQRGEVVARHLDVPGAGQHRGELLRLPLILVAGHHQRGSRDLGQGGVRGLDERVEDMQERLGIGAFPTGRESNETRVSCVSNPGLAALHDQQPFFACLAGGE